jgi:hypothetical protein
MASASATARFSISALLASRQSVSTGKARATAAWAARGAQICKLSMIFATCETTSAPAAIAPRRWPGMQKDLEKL